MQISHHLGKCIIHPKMKILSLITHPHVRNILFLIYLLITISIPDIELSKSLFLFYGEVAQISKNEPGNIFKI